jgi:hypothetical protein
MNPPNQQEQQPLRFPSVIEQLSSNVRSLQNLLSALGEIQLELEAKFCEIRRKKNAALAAIDNARASGVIDDDGKSKFCIVFLN